MIVDAHLHYLPKNFSDCSAFGISAWTACEREMA